MPSLAGETWRWPRGNIATKIGIAIAVKRRELHLFLNGHSALGTIAGSKLIVEVKPVFAVWTPEKHGRHQTSSIQTSWVLMVGPVPMFWSRIMP
jgi:hypothetical protein